MDKDQEIKEMKEAIAMMQKKLRDLEKEKKDLESMTKHDVVDIVADKYDIDEGNVNRNGDGHAYSLSKEGFIEIIKEKK